MLDRRIPHARQRVPLWLRRWRETGSLVLLLDFDGTLAPIVDRPDAARIDPDARAAIERLVAAGGRIGIISGRGLADVRGRVGVEGIEYAGNHGMEIELPGLRHVHPEAASARPRLQAAADVLRGALQGIEGSIVEDKGLTLSIHYRLVARPLVPDVDRAVRNAAEQVGGVRVTGGKEILEVRPDVDWDKGRAVDFVVGQLDPPPGSPVVYIGDDRTDEDAFRALRGRAGGEGVVVTWRALDTAATCYLETTKEVARLIDLLAANAPG